MRIQLSLVTNIRHAASAYSAAPATAAPAALKTYLSALEGLAEYVAAKWRGERVLNETLAAGQRGRTNHNTARVIPIAPATDSYRESLASEMVWERSAG